MKKTTLTILLCTFLATAIFTLAACETQPSGDGTPTGTSASVEVTTAEATTSGLRPAITAPQGVVTAPPYELIEIPEENVPDTLTDYNDLLCVKHAAYSWKERFGQELVWLDVEASPAGVYCYGVYDGVAVFFVGGDEFERSLLTVGEETYWNHYTFEMWTFKDGAFDSLTDAYGAGLLTDTHLKQIKNRHEELGEAFTSFVMAQLPDLPPPELDAELDLAIREAILAVSDPDLAGVESVKYRCFANLDGICAFYFDAEDQSYLEGIQYPVGDYSFLFVKNLGPYIFYDGEIYELWEAFAEEILCGEDIMRLYYAQHGKCAPDAE